jgi:DNA-binding Lrp family transcriptional regulator
MPKRIDFRHLKTVEALEVEGPRNITKVARKLKIPAETLRKRVRRMTSQFSWHFRLNIYHTYLGLKKALVFAQAVPGYEDLLFDCMKTNDFWLYVDRCYGMNEGCVALYTVPASNSNDLETFVKQLEEIGVASRTQISWSTCFHYIHLRSKWFDKASNTWSFHWDEWLKEIPRCGTELPITLRDPSEFPVKGDRTDVLILKELETNPLVRMTDLAKKIGISQQLAAYHYLKHVQTEGLIESFEISFPYFDRASSDGFVFNFEFDSYEKFAKFASSLLDKPFARGLGKVLGKNALIAHLYLPRTEFRRFIDALSTLIKSKTLGNYSYVIQDPGKASRQTISYEYFKNRKWIYDHEKHIRNLKKLGKSLSPSKKLSHD